MIAYSECPGCGNKNIAQVLSVKDYTVSGQHFDIWECAHCTLRFTQTIPGQEEIGRYYQSEEYISHSDTKKGLVNSLYHYVRKRTLRQKRKLVEAYTQTTAGHILDVGAGTGAFLGTMKKAGWSVTGIEPDSKARKNALDLYGLPLNEPKDLFLLSPATFEAITLWHVLEHVHQLHSYLEQLKELLTEKGKLFIAVPNYTSADAKIYGPFWAAYDVPRHLYHFSPRSMKTLLDAHGLMLETVKPMWYDSFYVSLLSEKYKTHKSHPVKAFVNGMMSNVNAVFHPTFCSSLIYIASRK